MLGKGPCGPSCNIADTGRSTRSTRPAVETLHPYSLGNFSLVSRHGTTDIGARVNKTYNETIISVNMLKHWEQETMHFSVIMEKDETDIDVRYLKNISISTAQKMKNDVILSSFENYNCFNRLFFVGQ